MGRLWSEESFGLGSGCHTLRKNVWYRAYFRSQVQHIAGRHFGQPAEYAQMRRDHFPVPLFYSVR